MLDWIKSQVQARTNLPFDRVVSIAFIGIIASSFLLVAVRSSFRKYGRGYIPGSDAFKRSRGKTGKGVGWKNPKRSGVKGRGSGFAGKGATTGLKGVSRLGRSLK